jgi:hypothetical protein
MVKEDVPARYRLGVRSESAQEAEEDTDDAVESAIRERSEAARQSK